MKSHDIKRQALEQNPNAELEAKRDLAYQVARLLEEAREARHMTQARLAERIGTHQSNIARAERGTSLPSLSFLKRIAETGFSSYLVPPQFAFMRADNTTSRRTTDSDSGDDVRYASPTPTPWSVRAITNTALITS